MALYKLAMSHFKFVIVDYFFEIGYYAAANGDRISAINFYIFANTIYTLIAAVYTFAINDRRLTIADYKQVFPHFK